jgi:hypothetical protein
VATVECVSSKAKHAPQSPHNLKGWYMFCYTDRPSVYNIQACCIQAFWKQQMGHPS